MAWPDGGTNEVVESIGATGRDYSTIAAWESATDEDCTTGWGTGVYADPCSPMGDCYDDADFDERYVLSGATTDSTHYRRLTVHVGERHVGKEGAGVTLVIDQEYDVVIQDLYIVIEWFLLTGTGNRSGPNNAPENSRCMIRNIVCATTESMSFYIANCGAGTEAYLRNCSIYGMSQYGIHGASTIPWIVQNCSILGTADYTLRYATCTNVIASSSTGTHIFFNCTGDYNIGSDTSAPGGHSIHSIAPADLFESIVSGSEDLHLKDDNTAASGAGSDLSASFTTDIDGETRTDWDIGADEYVSAAPPTGGRLISPRALYHYRMRRAG